MKRKMKLNLVFFGFIKMHPLLKSVLKVKTKGLKNYTDWTVNYSDKR